MDGGGWWWWGCGLTEESSPGFLSWVQKCPFQIAITFFPSDTASVSVVWLQLADVRHMEDLKLLTENNRLTIRTLNYDRKYDSAVPDGTKHDLYQGEVTQDTMFTAQEMTQPRRLSKTWT